MCGVRGCQVLCAGLIDIPPPVVLVLADVWLVLMGLVIGSFLNVVIARVPQGQSVVRPRSRCPKCGRGLTWYENIPVLSWIALRGRCKGCHSPISIRYPAVELLTAVLFAGCRWRFGWEWPLVPALLLVSLLIPLAFIDLEHWILPFELTRPGIVLGVLSAIPLGWGDVRDSAIGALAGFLVFWGLEWLGRKIAGQEALGGGDKYLLALLGGFLTYKCLLGVIFLSAFQGSIVGLLLKAFTGRAGPAAPPASDVVVIPAVGESMVESSPDEEEWVPGPSNLPFGPWLALAGLELLYFGPWIASILPSPMGSLISGS